MVATVATGTSTYHIFVDHKSRDLLFRDAAYVLIRKILPKSHLEKMYPAFDAFRTMAFVPSHTSNIGSHIRDAVDLKRTMITVIIALLPALFFGMWNIGNLHYNAIYTAKHLIVQIIMDYFLLLVCS